MTECNRQPMLFASVDRRQIVADFQGGDLTSDGGLPLLREVDRKIGLIDAINDAIFDPRFQPLVDSRPAYDSRPAHLRPCRRLRRPQRPPDATERHAAGCPDRPQAQVRAEGERSSVQSSHAVPCWRTASGGPIWSGCPKCSWINSSPRTTRRRRNWSSTSTPPTMPCMAIRKGDSSTATTITTASCRCTSPAASSYWWRIFALRTSTGPSTAGRS